MAKERKQKRRKSPAEKATNVILTLVVLAVLAIAVYAVAPQVKTGFEGIIAEKKAEEAMNNPGPDTSVLSGLCESLNMSFDEFKAEFGIAAEVTPETATSEVLTEDFINALPMSKYAKLTGSDYATVVDQMGLTDKVTEETPFGEAQLLAPLGKMAGGDEGFAQLKEYYGFDDTVTADTPYGDVKAKMAEIDAQKAAEAQAAAEAEAAAAEEAPATEEAPAENTEAAATEAPATEAPAENTEAAAE